MKAEGNHEDTKDTKEGREAVKEGREAEGNHEDTKDTKEGREAVKEGREAG